MRQTSIALYILGTLVLGVALLATGPKPDKIAVLVGAISVLAASVIDARLRAGQPQSFTTTDWLKGRRNRRSPLRSGLFLLAMLLASVNILVLDSPYSGSRHYIVSALLLVYVAIIGTSLFDKPETALVPERPAGENIAQP